MRKPPGIMLTVALAAAAGAGVLALTGCQYDDDRGLGDAPVGSVSDTPAEVVNFPDGYGNVATKCDGHGHRIYQVTGSAEVGRPSPVVIADPSCPGAAPTPAPR